MVLFLTLSFMNFINVFIGVVYADMNSLSEAVLVKVAEISWQFYNLLSYFTALTGLQVSEAKIVLLGKYCHL